MNKPQFHFSPNKGWINDPNGLVFSNGKYHMFYQYYPEGLVWGPMHWGHTVSKDLLEWEELDIALYPDDLGMIFSGSAVKNKDSLIAFYTNHREEKGKQIQVQSMAVSKNEGVSWEKNISNPILEDTDEIDFRDPKVFFDSDSNSWIMILAAGNKANLYSSKDLMDWKLEQKFISNNIEKGIWECPDLFKVYNKEKEKAIWILKVDIVTEDKESNTYCFHGKFENKKFIEFLDDSPQKIDSGRDFYACQTWNNSPDERKIWIGWMSDWKYARNIPATDSRGFMTLPRELYYKECENKNILCQKPIHEFYLNLIDIKNDVGNYIQLNEIQNNDFNLILSNKFNEKIELEYSSKNKFFTLKRLNSGAVDFEESFKNDNKVLLLNNLNTMEIILDETSVEIFLNDGEEVLTSLIFPREKYNKVEILGINNQNLMSNLVLKKYIK